jgi:hypothetical protein
MSRILPCKLRNDERGIALVMALFALVLMGALVSGSFLAGLLEQQSGQNSMFAAQALAAAEAGLDEALVNTDPAALEALPIGSSPFDLGPLESQNSVGQVIRLTGTLFLVRCTGTRRDAEGNPLATRSLALLVRIVPADGALPARLLAVTERGWVQLS